MPWQPLASGTFGLSATHSGVDPNFVWADASAFRDFLRPGEAIPARVPVIVELDGKPGCMEAFVKELGGGRGRGSVPFSYSVHRSLRYCTAELSASYCRGLFPSGGKLGRMIERVELQRSVIPQRPRPRVPVGALLPSPQPHSLAGEVLIGVIDTGCAFAHPRLRDASGQGTRLLNVWDQDADPAFGGLGGTPVEFGYGCEIGRTALNQVMRACRIDGCIDEAACYERADEHRLRHHFNHGTAVLDLFAGALPLGSRLNRKPRDPDSVPTWLPVPGERAASADIVFVQQPRDAVQDSSSAGLSRLILDGLRYIVGCAGPRTQRIVINISDGCSRGTHDGESIIERAMLAMVQEHAALGIRLDIVIAAGNSFDEERHAQFDTLGKKTPKRVRLRLPPGCETAASVSIVLPAVARGVQVRVTSREVGSSTSAGWVGAGQSKGWPTSVNPACAIVFPRPDAQKDRRVCVLVTFAPTASSDAVRAAPSGDYDIEVRADSGVRKPIHLYIPRNQPNAGVLRRAHQARFIDVDRTYDPHPEWRALERDPSPARSPIRRAGSVNGLATTPAGQRVHAIGSYRLREEQVSTYSSEGPALAGQAATRQAIDAYGTSDMSRASEGITAAATMGGGTACVRGTSFAAPQAGRVLADQQPIQGSTRGKLAATFPEPPWSGHRPGRRFFIPP